VFDVDLMISIDGVGGEMKFSHRPFEGIFNPLIIKTQPLTFTVQKQGCRKQALDV
jgi:hypothetical protein